MKKVIAFVSVFSPAFDVHNVPDKYYYGEEGKYVEGKQTNEAPLKYLLTEYKDIDQIICLISDLAGRVPNETKSEQHGTQSPYDYLTSQIALFEGEQGKENLFERVDYKEADEDYFTKKIIPEILQRVHPGDTIFLETTGGFRINITQMMLLTRILNYQGTKLACAVYSDFQKKRIFDVTDSYRDFDLVNGLNEFVSTGATGMLESYFTSETAKELVLAMKRLNEAIVLARIPKIQERKEKVEILLEKAEKELAERKDSGNSILTVLLPIFRSKYSQISTIPELIKWCASNNLIQQAFTLYKDWIPEYLIKDTGMITLTNVDPQKYNNHGKAIEPNLYCCIFDNEYIKEQSIHIIEPADARDKDYYVRIIKKIRDLMNDNADTIRYKKEVTYLDMVVLLRNYSYSALIRNDLNHAIVSSDDIPFIKNRRGYLGKLKDKDGSKKYIFDEDKLDIAYLKNFLIHAMDQIIELANR